MDHQTPLHPARGENMVGLLMHANTVDLRFKDTREPDALVKYFFAVIQ